MLHLEEADIDQIRPQVEPIAVPLPSDNPLAGLQSLEASTQIRRVGPHVRHGRPRRTIGPQLIDEILHRHQLARMNCEHREDCLLFWRAQLQSAGGQLHGEAAKNPNLHPSSLRER
nr:hypothetical protein [Micromonospora coriariae]